MTERPVNLVDVLQMLLTFQPRYTADGVAAALGADILQLRAALDVLERANVIEGTKKGTAREQWFSNVGDGSFGALLEEIHRLEGAGLLPAGFAATELPIA